MTTPSFVLSPPAADGRAAIVSGLGAALPPAVVSNAALCARLDTSDKWIQSRTGIAQRHIAGPEATTCDLAVQAAADALASSGHLPVQALVVATTTPDDLCPAGAPAVAARLGLNGIAAGCSGFLYALGVAAAFITAGAAEAVLVVGAERLSVLPDPADRATVPLFGDAAGAVVLAAGPVSRAGALGPLVLGSDGGHADLIRATASHTLRMHGTEVFRHAVDRMATAAAQAATAAGWRLDDVDHLAPHQANARIAAFVARQLGIGPDRQLTNIAQVGNTGAASIPLLLTQAAVDGRLRSGHRLLLTAFGSGLTWAAATLTWPDLTATDPEERGPA